MDIKALKALICIGIAELFALSLWFSASAIAPQLIRKWGISSSMEAWLSAAVPSGFVIGALLSAAFGIADRYDSRHIFSLSALFGSIANGLLLFTDSAFIGIMLRLLTGLFLAGVYPTAVKLLSQWFTNKRGLATGILVAALTIGSSFPHFLKVFFSAFNWQLVIVSSSLLALLAAMIMNWLLEPAPERAKRLPFSFRLIKDVFANKPVMLANYGYFGHMWELYAMWTWLPAFIASSYYSYSEHEAPSHIALSSFLAIGIGGGIGSILGGKIADKIGRSKLTIISMLISAACSLVIGFTYGHTMYFTFILAFLWGMSVIADSAQFSVAVTEFADEAYLGTALTFQMCIGFLITIFSINSLPLFQRAVGWEWCFVLLAIGPIFGIVSMVKFNRYEVERRIY